MEDDLRDAYLHGGKMGFEYMTEIGKTDLTKFSRDEALTFVECVCKNYHLKLNKNID